MHYISLKTRLELLSILIKIQVNLASKKEIIQVFYLNDLR